MVLGKKKKKRASFQVDYIVSIMEIKPWPPSVALCGVHSVLIQWENGEHNSGFLPPGVPSFNGFDDGKIEFNEFFKLPATLTVKNQGFQKNYLEFHLYEPKKDKAIKGQLIGSATINLAEYGIIKEAQTITAPIIIKKVQKGMGQSLLYLQIQPFDNEGIESVLKMMSEQCDEDCSELASLTDDDEGMSVSSRTPTAFQPAHTPFQIDEVLNFVNVGSWSKWLHDFLGPDDNDSSNDQHELNDETAFKPFHLLTALGDLMMLPTGMISDANTRKEVCPIFSGPVIKRVFSNFVPDEFSPNSITDEVLEALGSEDLLVAFPDCIKSFPCKANPVAYSPLPAALFASLLGGSSIPAQQKSGSSLLRKAHNSDDELDKLNIPLAFINIQNIRICPSSSKPNWIPRGKGGREVVRYQLLHEAWRNGN